MKTNTKINTANLSQGEIISTLLRFATPFLFASLLQSLYGGTDIYVVGKFADAASVSAVSVGSQVLHMLTTVIMALCAGATILIGQYTGAKRPDKAADIIGNTIIISLIFSALTTTLILMLCDQLLEFMKTPIEAVIYAHQYLSICACGIPFIVGYNAVSGILRGLGDSRKPLLFVAVACVVNVVLDILLVKGFSMGAKGAAIATSVSQGFSFVFSLLYIRQRGLGLEFSRKHITLHKDCIVKIFKIGTPIAFQNIMVSISFMLIMTITNSMGVIASAAVGVTEKLVSFVMLVPTATSAAVSAMVAQNTGSGNVVRAKKVMLAGVAFSLIFGIVAFVWIIVDAESLAMMFSNEINVINAAALYLKAYGYDCILVSFVFNMSAYFNGCGHSLFSMLHNLIAAFLVRIPLAYFFSRMDGATLLEIGYSVPIATMISLIMCIGYYIRLNKNKRIGIVDEV